MESPKAAADRGGPGRGPRGAGRIGSRTAHLLFAALALLFCAPYLRPGRVLLPTSPRTMPPWIDSGDATSRVVSNDLMADTLVLTLPSRVFNGERLRAGEIPFWNDRIFGGYPHLAMIQNNALYPLSAPFDLLEPVAGLGWSIALHLALAGSLAFLFLRDAGVSPAGALVGGSAFALNGLFLVRASAPSYVFSGTWFPLLLLGARRIARGSRVRDGAALVAGTALALLGGHPQVVALEIVAAAAYVAWLAAGDAPGAEAAPGPRAERRAAFAPPTQVVRLLAVFAATVALGSALVAFQLLPFAELLRHSARTSVPLDEYLRSALPPAGLLQAVLPDVFGHPVDGDYWFGELAPLLGGARRGERLWAFNYSGENLFTGLAPLLLAGAALLRPVRRREVAFLAGLGVVALATLLVPPLLAIAYHLVPGFAQSRPDRILFLWIAAVSLLAGHGFDALATDPARAADPAASRTKATDARVHRPRSLVRPVALALVLAVAWTLLPALLEPGRRADLLAWGRAALERSSAMRRSPGAQWLDAALVLGACAAIIAAMRRRLVPTDGAALAWVLAIALPAALFGWRFNPVQPTPVLGATLTERLVAERPAGTRLARILSRGPVFPANVPQLLGIDDANGASAAGLDRYVALVEAFDPAAVSKMKYFPAFRDRGVASSGLLDLLSVGVVLSDGELPAPWRTLGEEDGIRILRNPRALPRFFLVERAERIDDDVQALRRMTSPDFDFAHEAIVADRDPPTLAAPEPGTQATAATAAAGDEVSTESRSDRRIDLRVRSARGGLLVGSEVDYPGWEALVDGTTVPVLRTDVAFRAVAVPPGEHRVSFVFVPRSFRLGLMVSAVAALAIAWINRPRAEHP